MNKFTTKHLIFSVIYVLTCFSMQAQSETKYQDGELIVQFKSSYENINRFIEKYEIYQNKDTKLKIVEQLNKDMNIWLLAFDATNIDHERFSHVLGLDKSVIEFQNNHFIENRASPNDPLFNQQWQYINNGGFGGVVGADIDADLAWDITTGGVTPNGDTIVVCIVDDGLFEAQQDFGSNLWVNHQEIDGNGIDDDANGYIDDYLGYNANSNINGSAQTDNIYTTGYSHGTAVAGVVGAKGNNNFGVAGINWDVKLMIVKNQGVSESQVIKAYSYPLEMRKLYNETDGAKGAFVVAVNSSWGIDNGNPNTVPLWCAFYDEMGEAGIINAAATANAEINVDVDGDLPTGCSSDYLISVTNLGNDDIKVTQAAYGATTIDIGAFGDNAFTISDTDPTGFDGFGGTSGATPQVAGAIALLYSAPCESFAGLYLTDPAKAALKAKEYIMQGADSNTSLQGITVSGARLNLNGMLNRQTAACSECAVITDYKVININATTASILIDATPNIQNIVAYEVKYKLVDSLVWEKEEFNNNLISINNLVPDSDYDFEVRVICDSSSSVYTTPKRFRTNVTSINALAVAHGIEVYPNPVSSTLTIKLAELQKDFELFFYDITGKLIYQATMPSQKKKINIMNLDKGIYLLKLKDQAGNVFTHKIHKI